MLPAEPGGAPCRRDARFARFLVVGGSATALQYVLVVAFVEWADWTPPVGSTAAYLASAVYNYLLSRRFTFRSTRQHRSALPRFLVVLAVGLMLNALIVWAGCNVAGQHYLLAQLAATLTTLCWNYHASLRWAFARTP
jgi:putative flippase GtrA